MPNLCPSWDSLVNPFEPTLSLSFHHLHNFPLLRTVISFTLLSRLGKNLWCGVNVVWWLKTSVGWRGVFVPNLKKKCLDPRQKKNQRKKKSWKKKIYKFRIRKKKKKLWFGIFSVVLSVVCLEFVDIWRSKNCYIWPLFECMMLGVVKNEVWVQHNEIWPFVFEYGAWIAKSWWCF